MTAGPHAHIHIRPRYPQAIKRRLAHMIVIMLTGMYQKMFYPGRKPVHRFHDRGDFHKIRSCIDDVYYFYHWLCPLGKNIIFGLVTGLYLDLKA